MTEQRISSRPHIEAERSIDMFVRTDVVAAYYEAKKMLGQMSFQDRMDADMLVPPGRIIGIDINNGLRYTTFEGPDVEPLILQLQLKLRNDESGTKGQAARKDRQRTEEILSILDNNSTKENAGEDGEITFWDLGNRSTAPGYKTQRIFQEAIELAGNKFGATRKLNKAARNLGRRRELIMADANSSFYGIFKNGHLVGEDPGTELELLRAADLTAKVDAEVEVTEEKMTSDQGKDTGYVQREAPEVIYLEAREVKNPPQGEVKKREFKRKVKRNIRVARHDAPANPGRRAALKWMVGVAAVVAVGAVESRTKVVSSLLSSQSETHQTGSTVFPDSDLDAAPQNPATTTTTAESVTTTSSSTTTSTTEAPKPINRVGVPWITDTVVVPWGEQLVIESAKYGIDAALPAILMQVKTAGDYTVHTADLTGLFLLSNDVIKDGMLVKDLGIPSGDPVVVGLDARNNIKIGVWYIAKKYKELGNSINKTALELLGKDVEMAGMVEGMWNERKQVESPAFEKWKEKYGNRLIRNAREKLSNQRMI